MKGSWLRVSWLMPLIGGAACSGLGGIRPADDDTGDAPVILPLSCDDDYLDAPADLSAPEAADGQLKRVVQVSSEDFDTLCLAIYYPSDPGHRLYREGAPVVVSAVPALKAQTVGQAQVVAGFGLVEVQPSYPGIDNSGCTTSGELDVGGAHSAAAVRDAIRFATGELTTVEGYTLGQLVGMPTCAGRAVLLGASNGGSVAHLALATWPGDLAPLVSGLALHECPLIPQFVLQDVGATWMDRDHEYDADGNGVPWDDGLNVTWEDSACRSRESCELDYSTLAYSASLSIDEVFSWRYPSPYPAGLFYLDTNGNGHLDYSSEYATDIDENGLIDPEEDYVFIPQWDITWPDNSIMYFTPQVVQAAREQGLINECDWPEGIGTVEDTLAFWGPRTPYDYVAPIAQAYPEPFRVVIDYTVIDHGIPQINHPHIWALNEQYRDEGANVRLNGEMDMFTCAMTTTELEDFSIDLQPGQSVPEDELSRYAIPESVGNNDARVSSVLSVLWDLHGPFDRCPARNFQ